MNPNGCRYLWMSAIFALFGIRCNSGSDRLHDLTRENLKLTIEPANRFEFLYYSLRGTFNEKENFYTDKSVQYFCVGRYKSISINKYHLFPDPFNPDSIPLKIQYDSGQKKQLVHLIFKNDIRGNKIDDYKLIVYYDSNRLVVKGVNLDTTIQKPLNEKIRIDIFVADFFKNGIPRAIYDKLSTGWIRTKNSDELIMISPVSRYHYYYHDTTSFTVEELKKYYILYGKKVEKEIKF